jgi:hypothetical protein
MLMTYTNSICTEPRLEKYYWSVSNDTNDADEHGHRRVSALDLLRARITF